MYKTILLVDDDADDTELFLEAIGDIDAGITCYNAANGEEALQKLQQAASTKPDIIFLDINMPGMNGWQCLTELKASKLFWQIPVIIYSTSSAQRDRSIAAGLGALGFLTKPADYNELTKTLRMLTLQNSERELQQSIEQLST